jgi:hypothetical protein
LSEGQGTYPALALGPPWIGRWTVKRCSDCGEWKPKTEFGAHKARKDGLRGICKGCEALRNRAWKTTNPEAIKANNERRIARDRASKGEILRFQGGCCAICGTTIISGHLDHDHNCPKHGGLALTYLTPIIRARCPCLRGILCSNCNNRIMAAIDSGLALPGPEVQWYLDNPPAQIWFALLEEWETAS